jgi:hypothetical protein
MLPAYTAATSMLTSVWYCLLKTRSCQRGITGANINVDGGSDFT